MSTYNTNYKQGLEHQSPGTSGTVHGLLLHYFGHGPLAARTLTEEFN